MPSKSKPVFLVISQVFPPDPIAVGQHMRDAARGLAERGFEVRVLTSGRGYDDPTAKYPPRETMDGVDVIRLPLSSLGKKTMAHRLVGQSLFLLQTIFRGLFTPRLAGILVSTSPPMASIAALIIRLFRSARIKFWVMDLNPDQLIETGRIKETSLPARIFNALNRMILRASDDVVALDRFMAERLLRKVDVKDKISIQPPWPHSDHLETVEHAENPFRKEHDLEDKFVVMYSGNHGQTTPVTTVLDAAVRMQDRERLVFMFIGGGVGKRDVEATIAKHNPTNIIDLPYQPIDRIKYSLSAADVHLVTMEECVVGVIHPCKIYGAMEIGRPILSVGPEEYHVSDVMQGRDIGWHVPHGDVDKLIETLDMILALPQEKLREMGNRAAKIVQENYQQQAMIEEFTDIMVRNVPGAPTESNE